MFVSGGENIYPGQVEVVLETHPAVAEASVVPVDDAIKGQKPVAFVALKAGASVSEQELKAYALQRMPAYQHPRRVWIVDKIPLSSTSKVDRAALKVRAAAEMGTAEEQGGSNG